jgi:hypothetical protein
MNSRFALITFLDDSGLRPDHTLPGPQPPSGPVDPGWGVTPPVDPGWGVRPPVDPGYGHPGGFHPSHPIARPPVYPSHGLPVYPSTGSVPPQPPPVTPDNTLPGPPPGQAVQLPVFPPQIWPVPPEREQRSR